MKKIALVLAMLGAVSAHAAPTTFGHSDLDGVTVNVTLPLQYSYEFVSSTGFDHSAVVGDGVEYQGTATDRSGLAWDISVDISANQIKIGWSNSENKLFGSAPLLPIHFSFDMPTVGYLDAAGAGFDPGMPGSKNGLWFGIQHNGDFNFLARYWSMGSGDQYTINVSQVPEPGTYALLGAGLLAVGFVAKRKRQVLGDNCEPRDSWNSVSLA